MKEQTSRWLDLWIGIPLCWLLTLLRRCGQLLSGRAKAWPVAPPRKILFVKLAEMGAVVLTMPAFEAAARRVGRDGLYMVMLAGNREVHGLLGLFPDRNVWTIRDGNLLLFAYDVLRMLLACRRQGIDAVIDLEGFARISAVLTILTGARIRVGLHRYTTEGPYRGDLFTHRVALNYYQHASVQFLSLVAALDADPAQQPLVQERVELGEYRLPLHRPSETELAEVDELVRRAAGDTLPPRPWVVLNCNLIDLLPLRRWPRERFLELGRKIAAAHPTATLLLTGLPAEREASRQLAREISPDRAVSVAGDTANLRQLVTLLSQAALLVTSDCGPAHMAALTDTPIVSIFGPETPQLYSPLTPHNISLWAGLACSPCLNALNHRRSVCRENVCMQAVTVEQAFAAACQAWPELASRRG